MVIKLTINTYSWHQKQGQMWTMLNTFMNFKACLGFFYALMVTTDYNSYWVRMKFFEILRMALRNIFEPTWSSLAFRSLQPLCLVVTIKGWKSFKVYHTRRKGPSPYYNFFLPYILIPIKNNESKVVKNFRRTIF
jgi:hypothetical protein